MPCNLQAAVYITEKNYIFKQEDDQCGRYVLGSKVVNVLACVKTHHCVEQGN